MARLRFGSSKAGKRTVAGLDPTNSHTGFRPVDANNVNERRIREFVRDRAAQDGTAHVSTVELRNVGRNGFQAHIWQLLPGSQFVNPDLWVDIKTVHQRRRSDPNGISKTRSRQPEDNSRSRWLEPCCAARVAKPSQLDHLCDHPTKDRRDTVELGPYRIIVLEYPLFVRTCDNAFFAAAKTA